MKRKIIIIAAAVVVVAAAVAAGFGAHTLGISRTANAEFKREYNELIEANEELNKRKDALRDEISAIERDIESKSEISEEAQEYADRLNEIKAEVERANRTLTEQDETIKKKNEYIEKSDGIKILSRGRSVSLSDKTLKCPDDIAAGRYIAEGRGNLLIYNTENKLRISEDISSIDTNSFTFDIEEDESVKATETLTLTTLK